MASLESIKWKKSENYCHGMYLFVCVYVQQCNVWVIEYRKEQHVVNVENSQGGNQWYAPTQTITICIDVISVLHLSCTNQNNSYYCRTRRDPLIFNDAALRNIVWTISRVSIVKMFLLNNFPIRLIYNKHSSLKTLKMIHTTDAE